MCFSVLQVRPNSRLSKVTVDNSRDVIFVYRSCQAENRAAAPIIKVKEDFMLDYTELYIGSYDCNQSHCWRDIEVSTCCKCQSSPSIICRQLLFGREGVQQ